MLFADITPDSFSIVRDLTAFSLLAYLIIWGIPAWIDKFTADRAKDRESEEKKHQLLCDTFANEQAIEREISERRHRDLMDQGKDTQEKIDIHAKEYRHEIRNLAQVAELKKYTDQFKRDDDGG